MEDDVVTEGLVIFTSALDDLVVLWVVEVGSTVAVADAFFVAVIGVPVVDVPSLDAVLSTTAFADVVAASNQLVCLIRLSNYQFNGESNPRWRWVALLRFMIGPKHSGLLSQPITSIEN